MATKVEVTLHASGDAARKLAVDVLGHAVTADLNGFDRVRMTADQWLRLTMGRRERGLTSYLTWKDGVILDDVKKPQVIDVSNG